VFVDVDYEVVVSQLGHRVLGKNDLTDGVHFGLVEFGLQLVLVGFVYDEELQPAFAQTNHGVHDVVGRESHVLHALLAVLVEELVDLREFVAFVLRLELGHADVVLLVGEDFCFERSIVRVDLVGVCLPKIDQPERVLLKLDDGVV